MSSVTSLSEVRANRGDLDPVAMLRNCAAGIESGDLPKAKLAVMVMLSEGGEVMVFGASGSDLECVGLLSLGKDELSRLIS